MRKSEFYDEKTVEAAFIVLCDLVRIYRAFSSLVEFEQFKGDVLGFVAFYCGKLKECVGRDSFALKLLASEVASEGHQDLANIIIATDGENHDWII